MNDMQFVSHCILNYERNSLTVLPFRNIFLIPLLEVWRSVLKIPEINQLLFLAIPIPVSN